MTYQNFSSDSLAPQQVTPNAHQIQFSDIKNLLDSNQIATFLAKTSTINIERLGKLISDEERTRAMKFINAQDRYLSTVTHGLKRLVLSELLELNPAELTFSRSSKGKPFCLNSDCYRFSVTHSGEWTALSVAKSSEVGVDIEFSKDHSYLDIADFCFTQKELGQYIENNFDNLFFLKTWTQKESITKATGDGLFLKFSKINISEENDVSSTLIEGIKYYVHSEAFYDGFISAALDKPLTSLNLFVI